jgi:hypothetical protein
MNLAEMTYSTFGQLRVSDWFSKGKDYYQDSVEGFETCVGLTLEEGGVNTALFMSKRGQTAMVEITFTHMSKACRDEASTFLDELGLPIRGGISEKAVAAILGKPTGSQFGGPAWIVGKRDLYYIVCWCDQKSGLHNIKIYRKDLADKEAARD